MEHTKFFTLLQSLSVEELKIFRKRLSKTHADTDAGRLFELIYAHYPFENTSLLLKEYLYAQLHPAKPYSDASMRNLSHELLTVLEDYLIADSLAADTYQRQLLLLRCYRQRQLESPTIKGYRQLTLQLKSQPLRGEDYHYYAYQADREYHLHLNQQQNRQVEPQIQSLSDHLDAYYLIQKINLYIEALNYKNIAKVEYQIGFTAIFTELQYQSFFASQPILHIYHLVLMSLLEPEVEQHFNTLKALLPQYNSLLSHQESNDLLTFSRNYCIKRINQGDRSYEQSLFELYEQEIAQIEQQEKPQISPALYKNVVTLAINLNRGDWIKIFSEDYQALLPIEFRDSLYSFNMAKYAFMQGQYSQVIALLNGVEYKETFDQLAAKAILLKAYYELQEVTAFDSLVHSFKALLGDKKSLGYHGLSYYHFVSYAQRLFLADKKKVATLRHKLVAEKQIAERKWLLDKVGGG